jgi:hypothetical protein
MTIVWWAFLYSSPLFAAQPSGAAHPIPQLQSLLSTKILFASFGLDWTMQFDGHCGQGVPIFKGSDAP